MIEKTLIKTLAYAWSPAVSDCWKSSTQAHKFNNADEKEAEAVFLKRAFDNTRAQFHKAAY